MEFRMRQVHRFDEGRESLEPARIKPLIHGRQNLVCQRPNALLGSIQVAEFGQLARNLLAVNPVTQIPRAVSLKDLSALHVGSLVPRQHQCPTKRANVQRECATVVRKTAFSPVEEWQSGLMRRS